MRFATVSVAALLTLTELMFVAPISVRAQAVSCGMTLANVYRLPYGAFAVTVHDVDADGGIVRIVFKGPHTLQVTSALPIGTPHRADGTFTSDPIVVGPPLAGADTIEVKGIATGVGPLTCSLVAMPLASAPAEPDPPAKLPHALPLLLSYDLTGCDAAHENRDARKIADSPFPAHSMGHPGKANVQIILDDEGSLVSSAILRTDNVVLNSVSLDMANLMTFAPEIFGCRPVRGAYEVIVDYDGRPG